MHRAAWVVGLVLLVTIAGACTFIGERGEGPMASDSRAVGAFTNIEVSGGIGVDVTIGPAGPVVVNAQANIIPIIATEIVGDTLVIHGTKSFTATERVLVQVTTPTLDGITLSGGSSGQVDSLDATSFTARLDGGSGLSVASGRAASLTLTASGGSRATLVGLSATDVTVEVSGGSNASITASGTVTGSASGGARVTVSGGATLDVEVTGGASVERAG